MKIGFQKAFDFLSWNFLFFTMQCMGFIQKWIQWINEWLSIAHILVLVNGSSSEPFKMDRGVRQEDSLSPFLFLIAVEGLNCLLDKDKEVCLIDGIFILDSLSDLSLLQFVDDTLIFIPTELEKLQNLKRVLCCFELISGLKINFSKSSMVGLQVSTGFLSPGAECMGCKTDSPPIKYLGLPLSSKRISVVD